MTAAERWGRLGATVDNIQEDVREIKAFNAALGAKVDTNEKRITEIMARCEERTKQYRDRASERRLSMKARAAVASAVVLSIGGIVGALINLLA